MDHTKTSSLPKVRCIEFFSGIGGWSRALDLLFSSSSSSTCSSHFVEVCSAYDVNPNANAVYEHNYPNLKVSTRSIVNISTKEIDALKADMWVMSPPCQPFTRNNETQNRDSQDSRSDALIHLIHILQEIKRPPMYIALENVVGFEASECCNLLLNALETMGYQYHEYQLTPTQFGIPNERPRYYLIASHVNKDTRSIGSSIRLERKIRHSLDFGQQEPIQTLKVSSYINHVTENDLIINEDTLNKKSSWCLDIVHPDNYVTSCFTKSYSRYSKGTGSVLLIDANKGDYNDANDGLDQNNRSGTIKDTDERETEFKRKRQILDGDVDFNCGNNDVDNAELSMTSFLQELSRTPEERSFGADWVHCLKNAQKALRYFSPDELLSLFAFNTPKDHTATTQTLSRLDYLHTQSFAFPEGISRRKRYELIGNSVNVCVVAHLLMRLLSRPL